MALHRAAAKLSWATAASLLLALLGALLLWGKPLYSFLADQEAVRAWVGQFGPWAPAAVSLLEIAQVLLAPIPGQAIERSRRLLVRVLARRALCHDRHRRRIDAELFPDPPLRPAPGSPAGRLPLRCPAG